MKGIYSITNIKNGKMYVGSSKNMEERWRQHRHLLKKNKHKNSHLQSAWNLYGENCFEFSVIEIMDNADRKMLLEKEQEYINKNMFEYNISKDSRVPTPTPMYGEKNHQWKGGKTKLGFTCPQCGGKKGWASKKCINCNAKNGDKGGYAGNNKIRKYPKESYVCSQCGNKKTRTAKYCKPCAKELGVMGGGKKPLKKEHRDKVVKALLERMSSENYIPPRSKKVTINGIVYNSMSEAARKMNITQTGIAWRIKHSSFPGYAFTTQQEN